MNFCLTTAFTNWVRALRTRLSRAGGSTARRYVSLDAGYREHLSFRGPNQELVYAVSVGTVNTPDYNPLRPCTDVEFPAADRVFTPLGASQAAQAGNLTAGRSFAPLSPGVAAQAGDLDVLRGLRDLFATDPDGQYYIDLYYAHAPETGALGAADPALLWEAYLILQNFLPGFGALISGQGDQVIIPQSMVDEANALADELMAAGSPALDAAIAAERARYGGLQDFVGLTFNEALGLMGIEPPRVVVLPLITASP